MADQNKSCNCFAAGSIRSRGLWPILAVASIVSFWLGVLQAASLPSAPEKSTNSMTSTYKLLNAVAASDTTVVQQLLDSGVDVNVRTEGGLTAYHLARLLGAPDMMEYLAGHGADTNLPVPPPDQLVDALFRHVITTNGPGAAVLVARNGEVLFKQGYGLADVAHGRAFTPETESRIGSITKQFTAAAILKLQEEGKLSVTDKLSQYFPDFPRGDEVNFASPRFDVPLKNAHWLVFLPPDYDYTDLHRGTMTHESVSAAAEPASTSFSVLDYSLMEQANKESAKVEVKREVSQARQQLAGGNFREANASFSRAKAQWSAKEEDADVKKLGEELKSAQASNLVNAQNDFYVRNGGPLAMGAQTTNPAPPPSQLADETAAAGEQWTRLQQAQEIAVANVQPLRMNLPMRGQRLAFGQVLQTEIGHPMTFTLLADNTKTIHWPSRLAWIALAFGVLWGAVAALSRLLKKKRLPR